MAEDEAKTKITISIYNEEFTYSIERAKSNHTLSEFMNEMIIPLLHAMYSEKLVNEYLSK